MPHHTIPRQPLSCENCRRRKIKCSGDSVPCNTCVKRGHRHSCYFKKLTNNLQTMPNTMELLDRIRKLEDRLERHNSLSSQNSQEPEQTGSARTYSVSDNLGSESLLSISSPQQPRTIITSPSGHQHVSPDSLISAENALSNSASLVPDSPSSAGFPFTMEVSNSREALLDNLPPLSQCSVLKNVFFTVFSPLFHVLHDPTFDAVYEVFQSDPSSVSFSWLALLFVILGIAVTALDERHPLLSDLGRESSPVANMKKLSAKYRGAAMKCLTADHFLYQHNLYTVQTLILLIYAMNHANIPSWTLLGMTWNISVKIGCHIDPSSLNLGAVEGEQRRRCWAALMMLYTVQNTCMDNIAPQIFTANVQLPADLDDEDILEGEPVKDKSFSIQQKPTKMSYILYKFKLYKIAADICQVRVDQTYLEVQKISALDEQLAREEQEHLLRFSVHELPTYHVAHHYILQSYTNHLYLILHRPMLNRVDVNQERVSLSQQRCRSSAMTILEVYGKLCDVEAFRPYRWYVFGLGSFHAFLAASILIALLCKPGALSNDDAPRLLSLVENCIQRFEILATRSDICARASVILRQILPPSSLQTAALRPDTEDDMRTSLLSADSQSGLRTSGLDSQHQSLTSEEWRFNPELENLLFDATPQQWIAPNTSIWSLWDNFNTV